MYNTVYTTAGDLRWQKPKPARPWNDTFIATSDGEMGVACAQSLTKSRSFYNISEDCLVLNVYIPQAPGRARIASKILSSIFIILSERKWLSSLWYQMHKVQTSFGVKACGSIAILLLPIYNHSHAV